MGSKLTLLYVGIIAVVFAVVFSTQFDPKLHISGDNAVYLTLAKNMADGHGYASMGTDGEYHPASHFPPGYPAILSIFMRVGVDSLVFFKVLNGLFLLASLLLLFFMVRGLTGRPLLAFSAVLLAVFSPQTMSFATIAMSEMSYMFFITAGMFALYLYSGRRGVRNNIATERRPSGINQEAGSDNNTVVPVGHGYCFLRDWRFWAAVACFCTAYYIRSVAMSALGAGLVFFLLRREWKQAAAFVGGTVMLLLPWSVRNAVHGIQSRYFGTVMTVNPWRPEQGTISSFGEMVEKMVNNFDETVIKGFREILFPFTDFGQGTPSGLWSVIGGILVLAVIFFGAWKMGRLRWLLIFYLLGNIALFMLWHGGNGSRYVTPLAPLLFTLFYSGVYYIALLVSDRKSAGSEIHAPAQGMACWLPLLFTVMILPALSPLRTQAEIAGYPYPPAYENYRRMAVELNRQAPAGTVVVARKPDLFNYWAGKLVAVNYKYTTDPLELIEDLYRKNAGYVILEQLGYSSTPLYLFPAIEAYPDLFPLVWALENPETYLLGFDRAGAAALLSGQEPPYRNRPLQEP